MTNIKLPRIIGTYGTKRTKRRIKRKYGKISSMQAEIALNPTSNSSKRKIENIKRKKSKIKLLKNDLVYQQKAKTEKERRKKSGVITRKHY
tara:strand:- start:236 stop:508 length:273 start_codon:yes stop_codon:yes gene_type:complete